MNPNITKHAYLRAKQRCGWNKKALDNMYDKILNQGKSSLDLSGNLKNHVDFLHFKNKNANNLKVYGEYIFIFHNEVLITVYNIPKNIT